MEKILKQLRKNRKYSGALRRGIIPTINPNKAGIITGIIGSMIIGAVVGLFVWGFYKHSFSEALTGAKWGGIVGFYVYGLLPILVGIFIIVRYQQWPQPESFSTFSFMEKLLCLVMLSWCLVFAGNAGTAAILDYAQSKGFQGLTTLTSFFTASPLPAGTGKATINTPGSHKHLKTHGKTSTSAGSPNLPLKTLYEQRVAWAITGCCLPIILYGLRLNSRRRRKKQVLASTAMPSFNVWVGYSTGTLEERSHKTGLSRNQHVALSLEDASQNMLILGAIGSGKTTRAIHPFLLQLLDLDCGGLIYDIKGDFQNAVTTLAKLTHRSITLLGPGFAKINLLAGLTPEMAASFLKSTFLLSSKGHGDAFWLDTATELCRNTLGLLSFSPAYYSLQGLYFYLFDAAHRLTIDQIINTLLPTLSDKDLRLLNTYWRYQEQVFDKFDEKVKSGVYATIAQVLSPFNHPELIDAFCSTGDDVSMEAVLDGNIYLLSLPLTIWGLGGKVVYSLIKLRFYNVMQQRALQTTWNQDRPVFFVCDEFQEIVSANKDGLSDLNFWDKSRSSKTIGIISAQAISSFYAAIGDRDIAHALLQNFRQKFCFKTEDTATLTYFHQLADKTEVIRTSYSQTSSSQSHPDKFFNSNSTSSTQNTTLVEKAVLSPQLFRNLQPNQAVALLSIRGHSMDDVINMMPIYILTN